MLFIFSINLVIYPVPALFGGRDMDVTTAPVYVPSSSSHTAAHAVVVRNFGFS